MDTAKPDTPQTPPSTATPQAVTPRKVAHDTRNAVGLIWIHLTLLERRLGGDPEALATVKAVREETRRIVALMEWLSEPPTGG